MTRKKRKEIITWRSVFSRSSLAYDAFYFKHWTGLDMSWMPKEMEYLRDKLDALGLHGSRVFEGSPGCNCYGIVIHIPFLDGGFFADYGSYFGGRRGCWLFGFEAFRWYLNEVGIPQPRRFPMEEKPLPPSEYQYKLEYQAETGDMQLLLDQLKYRIWLHDTYSEMQFSAKYAALHCKPDSLESGQPRKS